MRVIYLTILIVIVDQLSKFFVKGINIPFLNLNINGMYPGESIPVLGNFLKITFTENPGMAFGFDPGSDFKLWISIFSLVASIGLLIYLYTARKRSLSLRIAIALILGGAVGNVIDRMFYGLMFDYAPVFYGKVVDFLDFDFFNFTLFGRSYQRWPIFNLADAAVSVGVIILLFFYKHHQTEETPQLVPAEKSISNDTTIANQNNITESDLKNTSNNDEADKGKEISV
jgi:signal peptidase II